VIDLLQKNIALFAGGQPLLNVVDMTKWY
jgi:hypothetical protein